MLSGPVLSRAPKTLTVEMMAAPFHDLSSKLVLPDLKRAVPLPTLTFTDCSFAK
ncbi:hypothetical protein TNIN_120471, partial [Trichonephila inaurata madagascariensis]